MSRVIVKYDDWARMGNRMFTYALGRIIAERKGWELIADPLPNFPNTFNHKRLSDILELEIPLSIRNTCGNNKLNYETIDNHKGDIIVDSFGQQSKHYINYRDEIREWFKIENNIKVDHDELVIHIRETDYKIIGAYLGEKFYLDMIKKLNFKKNTIVTDNCKSDLNEKLLNIGCTVFSTTPISQFKIFNDDPIMNDFKYIMNANNILLSPSSFSWWATFLGTPQKVYFPVTKDKGMWKAFPGLDDPDLFITEWIKIIV